MELNEAFENPAYDQIPEAIIMDFIMCSILKERCNRYLSLNPDMLDNANKLSLAYQRHSRCQGKLLALIKQIKKMQEEDI